MAVTGVVTGSTDQGTASEYGLKNVDSGGLIREDVMDQIFDISRIPLPLTDMLGSPDDAKNEYCEWTTDELADPDPDNAALDGDDVTKDDNKVGARVGNHCQIGTKRVKVSQRARNSDSIGFSDALSYQIIQRQRELRRDVEATMLSQNVSVQDDGVNAGKVGGLGSWIVTAVANGTGGGFSHTTQKTTAPTSTKAGMTETDVRDVCEDCYNEGGNPSVFMSGPKVIRNFSEYLFTSSARVATLQSDQGRSQEAAAALGSVNVFVTDFGIVLELIPNRIQQLESDSSYNAFIIDPMYLRMAMLEGYRVEPLAKTGTADVRMMKVDWTLKVLNEKAHGCIFHVDPTVAVTQS